MCKQIDHFPEETDYEADPSEYFLRKYIFSLYFHIQKNCDFFLFVFKVTTREKKNHFRNFASPSKISF